MARPKTDGKKTENPNFRMTKGEVALMNIKASIEGISMSELVRRAIDAYVPTPAQEMCIECGNNMVFCRTEESFPVVADGKEYQITITNIPSYKCVCGEITTDLGVLVNIEKAIDKLAYDAPKYQKTIPLKISIEELFKMESLGKKLPAGVS